MNYKTRAPNEILNTHVEEKVLKAIPAFVKEELDAMGDDALRKEVVQAHGNMKAVADELKANEKYQQAKASVDALSQGKKDTDKYQKAKITYALARLEGMGKLDPQEKSELDMALHTAKRALEEKKRKAEEEKTREEARALIAQGAEVSVKLVKNS